MAESMTWAEGWKKTAEAERERADRAEAECERLRAELAEARESEKEAWEKRRLYFSERKVMFNEARIADLEETVEALGVSLCDGNDGMLEQEKRIAALESVLRDVRDGYDRTQDDGLPIPIRYVIDAVLDKREP